MKAISASIIVLAAAVLLAGGSLVKDDTGLFLQAVACLIGIFGLKSWHQAFTDQNEK